MAIIAVLTLLLVLSGSPSPTYSGAAAYDEREYIVVAVSSLKPQDTCSGHRVTPLLHNHTSMMNWMPLHLPYGPCWANPDAAAPSLDDLLRWDELRADDIRRRLPDDVRGSQPPNGKPAKGGRSTVVNGTPRKSAVVRPPLGKRKPGSPPQQASQLSIDHPTATATGGGALLPGVIQSMALDTASDVPWVQCVPCPSPPCHPQTDAVFDPTRSATYAALSCSSPACARLGPYANGCANNNQCQYRVAYPDGSFSSGTYSSDVLQLNPTTAINSFQFGCSHLEQGNFDNQTSGILALGGGPESLVSQTAATYGNAFSYCIPPTPSYYGFFVLGMPPPAAISSSYVVTPMLRYAQVPTFYRVLLRSITVAGQPLSVPASVFAPGSVLDSRTVVTRLPPTAYQALRAAFRSSMRMYRSAPPKGVLDTCYDLRGVSTVLVPRITLVFDRNAVVELDPSGILFNDCLAFTSNNNDRLPGILGNLQQQTIEILYDIGGGSVGFRTTAC